MSRIFGTRLVLTAAVCAGLLVAHPAGAPREQRERSVLVGAVGPKDAPVTDLTMKERALAMLQEPPNAPWRSRRPTTWSPFSTASDYAESTRGVNEGDPRVGSVDDAA